MTALSAKRFRQIVLYGIEDHCLRNLVREIRRRIVSLADQHVRMAVEPLAEPIGLFTTAHTRRIVSLRDYQAVGQPGECNDGLHVHEILESHETCIGVIFSNTAQPGDAIRPGMPVRILRPILLLDPLYDRIFTLKIVVHGDANTLTATGELCR